jgi:hypothetical protein
MVNILSHNWEKSRKIFITTLKQFYTFGVILNLIFLLKVGQGRVDVGEEDFLSYYFCYNFVPLLFCYNFVSLSKIFLTIEEQNVVDPIKTRAAF